MTEYTIKNKRPDIYLPSVPMWIMDDLHLKVMEGVFYSMILNHKAMTWNYDFIGSTLNCSGETVYRMIVKLKKLDIVDTIEKVYGGKPRVIIVGKYTEHGKRTPEEMDELFKFGIEKLNSHYE